jgi:hypothetical protein
MENPEENTDLKRPSIVLFLLLLAVILAVLGLEWLLGFIGRLF